MFIYAFVAPHPTPSANAELDDIVSHSHRDQEVETVEMQTARVVRRYERSLHLTHSGKAAEAQVL